MWTCELKDVRERRNRWQIEGVAEDPENQHKMPFMINVRFGWLAMEGIAGPLFDQMFQHFNGLLGEPKEPPTCGGASECQDDAVHLTTSWEIGDANDSTADLLESLLQIPVGTLRS